MALDSFTIVNKSSPEFIQNNITIKETSYKTQLIIPRPRTTKYHKTMRQRHHVKMYCILEWNY